MHRRGFTLIELLTVIGIIGLLLAIILPAMERVRHRAYLQLCASNLRTIGQMVLTYSGENKGQFPRTRYVPGVAPTAGTNASSNDPFGPTGPAVNDVTAAFYLLVRTQHLPTITFICPYDDVFEYTADPAGQSNSNFTSLDQNLGYSFADPYPDTAAANAGYQWNAKLGADFALAADKNPGKDSYGSDVTAANLAQNASPGCSRNHERDGQNVLYADGHVVWQMTPLCGSGGDNIYTSAAGGYAVSPTGPADSLLLPTDDPE